MPEDERVRLGRLRWPVLIATRDQLPEATGAGIQVALQTMMQVRADVQPVGALTFWGSMQTDTGGITHRIFMRWFDAIDNECAIFRTSKRTDGTLRYERFRVRRWKELGGRKRFVCVECELETSGSIENNDGS